MTTNDNTTALDSVREKLDNEISNELSISRVTYEGPELIIYTDTPRKFAE